MHFVCGRRRPAPSGKLISTVADKAGRTKSDKKAKVALLIGKSNGMRSTSHAPIYLAAAFAAVVVLTAVLPAPAQAASYSYGQEQAIPANNYWANNFTALKGQVLKVKMTSNATVDMYLMDSYGYNQYYQAIHSGSGGEFTTIYSGSEINVTDVDYEITMVEGGHYYIVVDNTIWAGSFSNSTAIVNLSITVDNQTAKQTNLPGFEVLPSVFAVALVCAVALFGRRK